MHRDKTQVKAELEWVLYLHKNKANVYKPVLANKNSYCVKINAGSTYFTLSVFEKAIGQVSKSTNINSNFVYNWGKTIANFHKLSLNYTPQLKRKHYNDEKLFYIIPEKEILEDIEIETLNNKHLQKISAFSKNQTSYNLIHSDVHQGNIILNNDNLCVIDFDDSCYKWLVSDIAIAFYYPIIMGNILKSDNSFIEFFFKNFLKGYQKHYKLEKEWFEVFDDFLRLRDITLYRVFRQKIDFSTASKYFVELFESIKSRLKNQKSLTNANYKKMYLKYF